MKKGDPGFVVLAMALSASFLLLYGEVAVQWAFIGFVAAGSLSVVAFIVKVIGTSWAGAEPAAPVYRPTWRCCARHVLFAGSGLAVVALLSQMVPDSGSAATGVDLRISMVDWLWVVVLVATYDVLICFGPAATRRAINALFR